MAITIDGAFHWVPSAKTTFPGWTLATVARKRREAFGISSATCIGMACIPSAGNAAKPLLKVLKINSILDEGMLSDRSKKIPPKKGRKNCSMMEFENPISRNRSTLGMSRVAITSSTCFFISPFRNPSSFHLSEIVATVESDVWIASERTFDTEERLGSVTRDQLRPTRTRAPAENDFNRNRFKSNSRAAVS